MGEYSSFIAPDNVQLMAVHYADWFGVASFGEQFDPQERWEWLSIMPAASCPCDMLMIMPSRLATELNGNSGLFRGLNTTADLYTQLYGVEFPAGHKANWSRESLGTILLTFDTPWYPPSGEVMGEMSELFDCEIRHYWKSVDEGFSGYNCFDRGDHVDSGPWPEEMQQLSNGETARMYLVSTETTAVTPYAAPAAQYGSIRA